MSSSAPSPPDVVASLRAELVAGRAALAASIPTEPASAAEIDALGEALGRRNARLLDAMLGKLHAALATSPSGRPRKEWEAIAIAGVGSYGRGAVALKSDLDLRVAGPSAQAASRVADGLLYPLWDMGVSIGHQVVAIGEFIDAAREDLPTATSLLDWRHIVGDDGLTSELRARATSGIFAHSELPHFMTRLAGEVRQRHGRFGGSVYLLEPDVKNGAGGLRDLDVARWAARARWGVADLGDLVRFGALVPREAAEIHAASEMLWRVRNLLHAHAGRRSDRLTFDEQESIAAILGYGEGGDAIEHLMSAYYRAARIISRSLEMVLTRATPVLSRRRPHDEDLGEGVRLFDGCVTLSEPERLRVDPALSLRLVSAAVDRGVPLLAYARDVITRAAGDAAFCSELRKNAEAIDRFAALVTTCKEVSLEGGTVLRELHDLGLLLAMIPEFLPVVGRVHHDIYHVYTVDVHSVAAVDRLALLVRGELADEFPLASRLAAEVPRPVMLFLATLLHDVGKAIGGTDHSQRGAEMAREILARLGLPAEDVDEACHLIQKHLLMYHVATRRDLDDPAAIAEFSREVHGSEGLRDLYLLTVADLSTTSPTSMTSWKGRMLDQLYLAAESALAGRTQDDGRVQAVAQDVARAADAEPAASEAERTARRVFAAGFVASMPERYLLANAPAAISAHAELARRHASGADAVSVALVPSRHPEAAELCLVASDRPGLLAAITAALAASRLEVHAAQIHTRAVVGGVEAVDLFWVRDRGDGAPGVARAIPKLVRDINAVIAGDVDATELARKRGTVKLGRGAPKVRTQVAVDDRASGRHTVIEVTTRDRPGLLFAISDTLYRLGLTIAVAKINTEGTRVADVFYVSEADGTKVALGPRTAEVHARLTAALEALDLEGIGS